MANQIIEPGISKAGDLELRNVWLVDSSRSTPKRYNIWAMMVELNVFEDIFSPSISGSMVLVEAFNLISGIPILGDEIIVLEYTTPTLPKEEVINKEFYITKVGQRVSGDKKNVYELHFTSREAVLDLTTRISRAYSGNAHDIVKNIISQEFKIKNAEVEEADNKIKFVSAYWSPFKCINYAASRCLFPSSKIVTPNYLFYQTMKRYKLKSLSSLFKQEPFETYYFDKNPARDRLPDGTSTRDIGKEYQRVKEMYFMASQDRIDNTLSGALGHKVYGVNLLRKNFKEKTYQIDKDFANTTHLDKYPIFPINGILRNTGLLEGRLTAPELFDGIGDKADDILAKRISLLGQLDLFKMDLVVPGRTDIEVGMVVEFNLTDSRELDPEKDRGKLPFDPYYSGRYLITAIQHRINQTTHEMIMQIVKESSKTEIKL